MGPRNAYTWREASVASHDMTMHLTEEVELVESTRSDGLLVLGV
jgi:hypothetical protein